MIRRVKAGLRKVLDSIFGPYFASARQSTPADKAAQILLCMKYRALSRDPASLPRLEEVGFRAFSQNDEDGILLYIFSLIGMQNRMAVEICAGDGIESNTANLIINHGWTGLLFDGDEASVERGQKFYVSSKDTQVFPPRLVHAWIEVENVNRLIQENGFEGEVDLLSLDLDGVDYWIWRAINVITPRVVVLEYHNIWGPDRSVTVPYRRDFDRHDTHPDYCGASLPAFVKLGREKGYRLVGCNRYGFNAFFVRAGVGEDVLPEIPCKECFRHLQARTGQESRLPDVLQHEWVDV